MSAAIPSSHVELTPQLIAKAQKHCRFAISSLDYEDAEQAKKELRTALALLEGL
jgi:vacuolar protein sorting-associated protein VTA1